MNNSTLMYNHYLKVLLPFDLIFDTDFGLIKLIQNEFMDPDIFNVHMLNDMDDDSIVNYCVNRIYENPLYGLSNLKHEELDELYEDFMKTKYKEILELSNKTYLGTMFQSFCNTQGLKVFVYYTSDLELEKLSDSPFNLVDCREREMNLREMKNYDAIYVKHPSLIPMKLEGKTLYYANYEYMYLQSEDEDKEKAIRPDILIMTANNIIKFNDIYLRKSALETMVEEDNENYEEEEDEDE